MMFFGNILFAAAFVASGAFSLAESPAIRNYSAGEKTVYVCTKSDKAYAYHTHKDCQHIRRCWEENHIETMSISKARSMNRSFCKTCAKRDNN